MNNTMPIIAPNNKGYIVGRLLEKPQHYFEVEGEKFYEGKLCVERLSQNLDILPITISEKLVTAYNLNLDKGLFLALGGEFRSYNKVEGARSRLILSFFIKEIFDATSSNIENANELSLTGFVCKEPVFRTTPFNRQICDVLVAVNRPNFNKSDYIPCIMWGRNAKLMQNQKVGTKISLFGRIQSRKYKKEVDGIVEEKTAYEVSCQKLIIEQETLVKENKGEMLA